MGDTVKGWAMDKGWRTAALYRLTIGLGLLVALVLVGCAAGEDVGSAPVPIASVDFEQGGAAPSCPPICSSGDLVWSVTDISAHSGTYSVRSGFIGDNQFSCVSYEPGIQHQALGFYYRVSTEADFDFVYFYVNGLQVDDASGEIGWSFYHHNAGDGFHYYEWCYEKDFSVSAGLDLVFLDDLEIF